MSPTEDDLRAALRAGEGDPLNAERIIWRGQAVRAKRRSHLLNALATVLVIAGVGGFAGLLLHGTFPSSERSDSGGASLNDARAGAHGSAASPAAPAAGDAARPAPGCPASLPRYLLPGGSSPSQFGPSTTLFAKPVAALVVCAYGALDTALTQSSPAARRIVLTGTDAITVADSLERSATTKPRGMCSQLRSADEQALAIIPVARDGSKLRTVTTTINRPACSVEATNGTAVRYAWSPPALLTKRLAQAPSATGGGSPEPKPSPTNS